jgi:AraC-like DNA-binding protein
MADDLGLVDTLLRGINAGAALLLALVLLLRRPAGLRRMLGAGFALAGASYLLNSAPSVAAGLGPAMIAPHTLAIVTPVIFWWFALALFDDDFRWRWRVFAPLALIAPFLIFHFFIHRESLFWQGAYWLNRAVAAFVFGHVLYVAIRYLNDDLIEGRRRFRVVFAAAIAVTGIIITYVESSGIADAPPAWLLRFQAVSILLMTLGFGAWILGGRSEVLDGPAEPVPAAGGPAAGAEPQPALRAADRAAYDRLAALMSDGVYREEGLSVAGLAEKVGVPEHQLRKLINGALGFRNFSAFLNARRIEDAKAMLADPANARRQVLQIALDLGYGSIAPFNRAFKEGTGMTPTEYRRTALGER